MIKTGIRRHRRAASGIEVRDDGKFAGGSPARWNIWSLQFLSPPWRDAVAAGADRAALPPRLPLRFPPEIGAAAAGPDISHFTLANGLEVVVIPDHRTPVVTHMIWYKVGSADETAGKSGLAHFLEHLMFKGTAKNPEGRFSQTLATIGGQENAFTTPDYTAYFQRIAKEYLPKVMEFEADRMTGLVLTDANVLPERDVVLEEFNMRVANSPEARIGEQVSAALYLNHPYGRPVIGWHAGNREAQPRGRARLLPALLHPQQCGGGDRRRRHRRRGQAARREDLRRGAAARRDRSAGAAAGAAAGGGSSAHHGRSAGGPAQPAAQLSGAFRHHRGAR